MIDFSKLLFRCSSLGYIMTEPRNKNELLSETCKTHLIDVYVSHKYGRHSDISNKYIEKGLMVEEDSITLYSRIKKRFFKKNEQHLSNDLIKGTPDLFTGFAIDDAKEIIDIKSSWDIFSFFRIHTQPLNKHYYWQTQGYMALTGAAKATIAYCLVNTPAITIGDEKRRLLYKMGMATDENELAQQACAALEQAMIYDDIPIQERVIELSIERNDEDIEHIYKRIKDCRDYLCELENNLHGVKLPCTKITDTSMPIETGIDKKKSKKQTDETSHIHTKQRCTQ